MTTATVKMTGEVHPVAALFPMLPDDELDALAADIAERGLLQPIVLDTEGRVLDGRNRLAACERAGVEPKFVTYEGDDPEGYAIAVNVRRRQLKPGALALVAARHVRVTATTEGQAARLYNLYRPRVAEAGAVLDWADDLVDAVETGAKALSVAVEEARRRKDQAEALTAKLERLGKHAPDLRASVDDERLDVDDAIAALDAREKKTRTEEQARAEERRAHAERVSESLRMATNSLVKALGTDELRQQAVESYVDPPSATSELNAPISADVLRAAGRVCNDLATRWEKTRE